MIVSPSDFSDWRQNNVTKAFFEACHLRIEDAKNTLSVSAGISPVEDNFLRGFILAYREMFDFRIDDLQESSND